MRLPPRNTVPGTPPELGRETSGTDSRRRDDNRPLWGGVSESSRRTYEGMLQGRITPTNRFPSFRRDTIQHSRAFASDREALPNRPYAAAYRLAEFPIMQDNVKALSSGQRVYVHR